MVEARAAVASRQTAKERYDTLEEFREPYLIRARDCAKLTIPYLVPPKGFNESQKLPTPYQSLGARGVRTLSAKLSTSLFPPNTPFYKYEIDDLTLHELTGDDKMRGQIELALNARERAIMLELEASLFRVVVGMALQHLVVSGNFLIHVPMKGRARGFRLEQFVVRRDPEGNLLEFVVRESIAPSTMTPEMQQAIRDHNAANGKEGEQKTVDLYTHVQRGETEWTIYQEVCEMKVPGSDGTYPLDKLPWIVLRLVAQPGESYGRSYIEELLGDLDSLEGLSETLVEGSAAAARVVFLVKPNGTTSLKVIATARTGDVRPGNAEDVGAVQTQKQADLAVAQKQAEAIAQRLAYSFLLNTAVQRDAERVTAEEIRYMAQELDDALGGVHTLLSAEFQLAALSIFERRMEKNRKVPPLPKDTVKPLLITGIGAIGRGIDLKNLQAFTMNIIQTLTPQIAFQYLNPTEYIKRAAAAYGLDVGGLVRSDEEIAQQQQMAQLQQLIQNLGPQAISAMGGMGKTILQNQLQPQGNENGEQAKQPAKAA
jgi:hypothetical protein